MDQITRKTVIVACLLLTVIHTSAATSISIDSYTSAPDGTVTVPIRIDDIRNYGTGVLDITYDPSVVIVTDVVSSADSTVIAKNINNTVGVARISAWNTNGVNGSIVFANMALKAVGSSGDSSSFTITANTLQDISYKELKQDIEYHNDGMFTISGSSGDAAVTPTPDSTGDTVTHNPPPSPDAVTTETESGSDTKPAAPGESSDPVQSQSHPPTDRDTEPTTKSAHGVETPSMKTPFPGVMTVCLSIFIVYLIRRNGGSR